MSISLVPLSLDLHVAALQELYRATPSYWARYNFPAAPAGQAENDLRTAATMPGRTLMGIVQPLQVPLARVAAPALPAGASSEQHDSERGAAGELLGLLDFRLHWPAPRTVYLGMVMVAEAHQRRGVGSQAWRLLHPWLTTSAGMQTARLAVEQFNPAALQFFQTLGFQLTGDANRTKVGDKFVRLLYMEQRLA